MNESTSSLPDEVAAVFSDGGALDAAAAGLAPRAGQVQMAREVAATMQAGGALVVEAATGVGKTYAYLVPALLSGQRVLVSTATKALQDQLFERDLPWLTDALGVPVHKALLKGRASYLCLQRLDVADQVLPPSAGPLRAQLAQVQRWAPSTTTGDMAELASLDENADIMPWVTSTRENCLGADCPHARDCWVTHARRAAMAADVVVINHHLFFADLAIRESGVAELLPTVHTIIFDEAHKLNAIGVQFLGRTLSTGQLRDYAKDLKLAGLQHARGLADWRALAHTVRHSALQLHELTDQRDAAASTRAGWSEAAPEGVDAPAWQEALQAIDDALGQCAESLAHTADAAPELARLYERAGELQQVLASFAKPPAPGRVRWIDAGASLRLVDSPLDIADTVRSRLLGHALTAPDADVDIDIDIETDPPAGGGVKDVTQIKNPVAPNDANDIAAQAATVDADADADTNAAIHATPDTASAPGDRAWIFVSATLGDDARLSWFTESCGLQSAQVLRIASPFDYRRQAVLYIPMHFDAPGREAHLDQVAALAAHGAQALGGRTLVLTTTRRALHQIADSLAQHLAGDDTLEVLAQGERPKRVLLQRMRNATRPGRRGCVVVASASFWEGVDVPGEALQLVVIDKLPFPPPGDPLMQARAERIKAQGRSAFAHYFVPAAAVALKQGAGRLIRSEDDKGIIAICDRRLLEKGYGKRLLAALPQMALLRSEAAFTEALARLAASHAHAADAPPP